MTYFYLTFLHKELIANDSCHLDITPQGNTFAHLYPQEDNTMLSAFQNYAKTSFHK